MKIVKLPERPGYAFYAGSILRKREHFGLFLLLLLAWFFGPMLLRHADISAGSIDQSTWLLVIISLIAFMVITSLCWWLSKRFWLLMGLPSISIMVSQFNTLLLWQQLGFFMALYALLLLAATGSLLALC